MRSIEASGLNYSIPTKNKPRLYNKEITTYYIHWASKFVTVIIKRNETADYIHGASKVATSAYKRTEKRIYKTKSTLEGIRPALAMQQKQQNKPTRPQL